MREYDLKVRTRISDGKIQFAIFGKLINTRILCETWGYYRDSIAEAFKSFEEELERSIKRLAKE